MTSPCRWCIILFLPLLWPLMLCCHGEKGKQSTPQSGPSISDKTVADDRVVIQVGGMPVRVRVSQTPEEKQRGLMYTERLFPDEGMLFVFDDESRRAFWMKNTPVALDIAYIDRMGQIVEIQKMMPLDTTVCISERQAMYALEMNAGWFQAHGVKVGDRVEF